MRPNLFFSRFCKLFSGPFKENILGIGLCCFEDRKIIDISGISSSYHLKSDMSASWGWMKTSVTSQTRHPMLPVHHTDCLVSRFLPENVSIVTKSLFDCWHGHFVAQGPDYKMLTRFLDFTHRDQGQQTGSSYLWALMDACYPVSDLQRRW